jgi:hypothetical protein
LVVEAALAALRAGDAQVEVGKGAAWAAGRAGVFVEFVGVGAPGALGVQGACADRAGGVAW